jgi:hypothetical protein
MPHQTTLTVRASIGVKVISRCRLLHGGDKLLAGLGTLPVDSAVVVSRALARTLHIDKLPFEINLAFPGFEVCLVCA